MMTDKLLITLALTLPIIALVFIFITRNRTNIREAVTLISAALLIFVCYCLLKKVLSGGQPALSLFEFLPDLEIHFKIEPFGMLFACIASFLWLINSVYSIGYMRGNNEKNQTRFYICFTIAVASTIAIAFSANLITLFIFYEVLTLSTYPLVTHKGNEHAMRAGRVYLGILLSSSILLFLPAIIWVYVLTGSTEFVVGGVFNNELSKSLALILLMLFSYGIAKAALMPIHVWLPRAMVAPTPVSALLHAVAVVKAGVFSLIKIVTYTFSPALLTELIDYNVLLYLSGFSIIIASIIALRSDNLKRRLAYSTISQLAYIILATALLAPISIIAAGLHILAHAFGKITLFFAAGSIYTATKKTTVTELNGIAKVMPWTMSAFAIASLSMIGLPPTIGFFSKWYLLHAAFDVESWFAVVVIIISTLLNAAYFLPIIYAAFFKQSDADIPHNYQEGPFASVAALTVTACITVLLFFLVDIPLNLLSL